MHDSILTLSFSFVGALPTAPSMGSTSSCALAPDQTYLMEHRQYLNWGEP